MLVRVALLGSGMSRNPFGDVYPERISWMFAPSGRFRQVMAVFSEVCAVYWCVDVDVMAIASQRGMLRRAAFTLGGSHCQGEPSVQLPI